MRFRHLPPFLLLPLAFVAAIGLAQQAEQAPLPIAPAQANAPAATPNEAPSSQPEVAVPPLADFTSAADPNAQDDAVDFSAQNAPDSASDADADANSPEAALARIARQQPRAADSGLADLGLARSPNLPAQDAIATRNQSERAIAPAKWQKMLELADMLGALHSTRVRCGAREDQTYRARMAQMLSMEAPPGTLRRQALVDRFNNNFARFGGGEGGCLGATAQLEEQLARRAEPIARQLAALYAPPPVSATPAPANNSAAGRGNVSVQNQPPRREPRQ